ncbi:MAG: hypothetical protein MRY72_13070 [Aquisalinus sp.]|nr:hypothetical protein [Aquisalinus sp.]
MSSISEFDLRPAMPADLQAVNGPMPAHIYRAMHTQLRWSPVAVSWWRDGQPKIIAGLIDRPDDVELEFWMMIANDTRPRELVQVVKACRPWLNQDRPVIAYVDIKQHAHVRFAERFDFRRCASPALTMLGGIICKFVIEAADGRKISKDRQGATGGAKTPDGGS